YIRQIERKTALFIEAAAACGGMARGLDEEAIRCLEQYGYHIGMAFQIKDDILDEIGGEEFGKQKNQDRKRGLKTLPQIIGLAKSEEAVKAHSDQAIQALQTLPESSAKNDLVKMAKILVERTK
ncbi:MAG: polyprenyl synthetase family protein, partial [Lachnospiraceae bacterium]|nr:polyprenyl synthetase family protein [Lachnospiraceae bacterium]